MPRLKKRTRVSIQNLLKGRDKLEAKRRKKLSGSEDGNVSSATIVVTSPSLPSPTPSVSTSAEKRKRIEKANGHEIDSPTPGVPTSAEKRKKIGKENEHEIDYMVRCFSSEEKIKEIVSNMVCKQCCSSNVSCQFTHRQLDLGIKIHCKDCLFVIFDDNKASVMTVKQNENERVHPVTVMVIFLAMQFAVGYSGFQKLCHYFSFRSISDGLYVRHAKYIASKAVLKADEILERSRKVVVEFYRVTLGREPVNGILDLDVTYDATWQNTNFGANSNFFVGTVIDAHTRYVVDYIALCGCCIDCNVKKQLLDKGRMTPEGFTEWYTDHACDQNFTGPNSGMKKDGAQRLWNRSTEIGFRYVNYICDGDNKCYNAVISLNNGEGPYGSDHVVRKEECVEHVSKRLGNALRNLSHHTSMIENVKKRKFSGGFEHLTETVIEKLQLYFMKVVRERKNSGPKEMKECILSSFYHYSSSDENPKHHLCPKSSTSWCFFQKARASNETPSSHDTMKIRSTMEPDEVKQIEEIYKCLTSDEILMKCLRGKLQSPTEPLGSRIWQLCPKYNNARKMYLDFAAAQAVSIYNAGYLGSNLNNLLGIPYSNGLNKFLIALDANMCA